MRGSCIRGTAAEDGAVAVFVGILLVVLIGMVAITVDVGALYHERRALQNGADAAVLAIAEDCARGAIDCVQTLVEDVAEEYADDNAPDGAALAEDVELDVGASVSEATVTTLTEDAESGENTFHLFFAPVLGFDDTPVRATASARWGPAVAAEGFPFGVCEQLWKANRPLPDGTPGPMVEVRYKGPASDPPQNDCLDEDDDDFNPGTKPGNFSWLDSEDDSCTTEYDFSDGSMTASGNTGADVPNDCSDEVDDMIDQIQTHKAEEGDVVHPDPAENQLPIRILPIYSTVEGEGTNAEYQLVTFGAFEFSGMKMKGGQNDVVNSWTKPQCQGGAARNLCVQGRFVREVSEGAIQEGFDSDVIVVELSG